MGNFRSKSTFADIITFAVVFTSSLFVASRASALERIRIALSVRNVVFLPFYYAKDAKIFERHGLDAELIQMRSDLQLAGLVSGEIDFTPAVGPATFGIANGMPLKAVAILYRSSLFSLVSPPNFGSVKDLEGKRVAVSRIGSDSHRFGSLMIENGGADPKKVTFIQTGSTTVSLTAVQQGAVNAAVLSPPFTGMMAEKGFKILARSRSLIESPWLGLVASRQKLDKQAEQTRNVLRSMRDVIGAIRRDKPGIVAYIEKNFKVSAANAEESYEDINGVMLESMIMRDDQIQKYLDNAYSRSEIPKPLSASEMFDFSLLRNLK